MEMILVGAGNVASSLGPALLEGGYSIGAVMSRTMESAHSLASRLGTRALTGVDSLKTYADGPGSDMVCIAMLKDNVLLENAQRIVEALGKDTLFLHTAGSVPMDVWKTAGALRYGVLYPMTSFTKSNPVSLLGVPLFVEASDADSLALVMDIAHRISASVTRLDSNGRLHLHLAAVFASNFSCHMMAIAQQLLMRDGVDFKVMLPLVRGMVSKLEHMTPLEAETGPALRGDSAVVNHHLEMLAADPEWQQLYRLVSKNINPNLQTDD